MPLRPPNKKNTKRKKESHPPIDAVGNEDGLTRFSLFIASFNYVLFEIAYFLFLITLVFGMSCAHLTFHQIPATFHWHN